jgi:hypothetical protein
MSGISGFDQDPPTEGIKMIMKIVHGGGGVVNAHQDKKQETIFFLERETRYQY